jgi:hypothetical protein
MYLVCEEMDLRYCCCKWCVPTRVVYTNRDGTQIRIRWVVEGMCEIKRLHQLVIERLRQRNTSDALNDHANQILACIAI